MNYFDDANKFMKDTQFIYEMISFGVNVIPYIVGNLLDLMFLGATKRLVNVTPLMNHSFFGFVPTRQENPVVENRLLNCGFSGLLRFITAAVLELPIKACSLVLAAGIYLLKHLVIMPLLFIGIWVGFNIADNFCGPIFNNDPEYNF